MAIQGSNFSCTGCILHNNSAGMEVSQRPGTFHEDASDFEELKKCKLMVDPQWLELLIACVATDFVLVLCGVSFSVE